MPSSVRIGEHFQKKMGGRDVLNGFDTVDSSEILLSPPGMYKNAVSEGTHIFGVQI